MMYFKRYNCVYRTPATIMTQVTLNIFCSGKGILNLLISYNYYYLNKKLTNYSIVFSCTYQSL